MARAAGRLVGREAELARLGDAVERARSGARVAVFVEADAGLGKSRLVSEVLAARRDPTDLVGVACGIELTGGQIPYGAATDLLRTLVRDAGADRVRTAAGAYAPALARLCPDLGPEVDAEAAAARVLPAWAATVETLAEDGLVWLVVDDLPWVDPASRDLVAYLVRVVRSSPLLVLVTVRSHDPTSDPALLELVDGLGTLDGVDRVALAPLGRDDAATLVADLTEGTATPQQAAGVVAAGQGSPLLTEQLVAAGLDSAAPEAVVSPIQARLRRLDPDTLRLVQLAALGDGHLSHRLLRLVCSWPDATFDSAVDRALGVRLLEYRPEQREFTFTHPLLRRAAEDTLTPAQRLRGHQRWGEVLGTPDNHHHEARLLIAAAHHWSGTDDDVAAFTSSLEAARATDRLGDTVGSSELMMRAWELWDRVPDAAQVAGRDRDDLLLDLGDRLQASDRLADWLPHLEGELDRTRRDAAAPPRRAHLLAMASRDIADVLGEAPDPEAYDAVPSATLLAEPSSRLVARALNAVGWHLRWTDPAESFRLFARALAISRELGTPDEIAFTSGVFAIQLMGRGRHEEAMEVCATGLQACVGLVDRLGLESARGDVLAESGQLRAAVSQLEHSLARLPDPGLAAAEWTFTALRAIVWSDAVGDWTRSDELLAQVAGLTIDQWFTRTWACAQRAECACLRGDLDEATRLAEAAWAELGAQEPAQWFLIRHLVRRSRALVAAARGDHTEAQHLLEPMLTHPGIETDSMRWGAAELAARVEGDRASAPGARPDPDRVALIRTAVEALPRRGPHLTALHGQASADLARAEHADTAGIWAEVRDVWAHLDHLPNAAWAGLRLAAAHVRAGDRRAAAAALVEAWAIAARLGAVPLREAVADFARTARVSLGPDAPVLPRTGPLARLTEREVEVLRHVAAGRSNDEIAGVLFISPKTVSVHVSRILTKLDAGTRTAAAALAYEAGLAGSASPRARP
jgi:DNA-binding CsgD family transcriptional regulator